MPRWTHGSASLTVTDDLALAELPDPSGRVITHGLPHRMLVEPAWQGPLCEMLGVAPVVEAIAWAAEFRLPIIERVRARVRGRLGETPCRCGEEPATALEHGEIRPLARVETGGRVAEVGRCNVCGRAWTFVTGEGSVRTSYDGGW